MDLCHPQLAPLHPASQIDFAFASEQRNSAHLAQVHAYQIVGVNRLFGLLGQELLFLDFYSGWKKLASSSETEVRGVLALCKKH